MALLASAVAGVQDHLQALLKWSLSSAQARILGVMLEASMDEGNVCKLHLLVILLAVLWRLHLLDLREYRISVQIRPGLV